MFYQRHIFISFVFITLVTLGFIATPKNVQSENIITKNEIDQINSYITTALNKKAHVTAIQALHYALDQDVQVKMIVENPTMPAGQQRQIMNLDKASYINSFLQALPHIASYQANIRTQSFDFNPQTGVAKTTDVMTETGAFLNNMIVGESAGSRPFTTETICETEYQREQGQIKTTDKICKVRVSFDENI